MDYYVDMDGTVLAPTHATSLDDWMYKIGSGRCSVLNLNLLRWLKARKEEGHTLYVWTDRSPELYSATMRNLGKWSRLFDMGSFNGDGVSGKAKSKVDGFVIDDKEQYVRCGVRGGMQVTWTRRDRKEVV